VDTAKAAVSIRRDIFTEDALAWGYFRGGQLAKARESIARALRTGSRDRTILYHAAAIANATGNQQSARHLIDQALSGAPHFDVIVAPAAAALRASLGSL